MKKILLVDDNLLMRKLIINLFQHDGISFDEACDGEDGLAKLSENRYDLIITDIIMPKMEGIELIREVKHKYPDTQIFAISGGMPFYLYMAKKFGIQGIFTKPIDQQVFHSAVIKALQFPNNILLAS